MQAHKDVRSYIAAAPKEVRTKLLQLRTLIRSVAPEAEEKIAYGMPGYKLRGKPFAYFAAFKDHVSFFPASGTFLKAHAAALRKYKTGKGTVQFPLDEPLPLPLLRRLVRARMTDLVSAAVSSPRKGVRRTCSRGHVFYKSSDCPVCPKCWSGHYRAKGAGDLPATIGAPALRALLRAKITSLAALARRTEAEVAELHGMGPKALGLLKSAMRTKGRSFRKKS